MFTRNEIQPDKKWDCTVTSSGVHTCHKKHLASYVNAPYDSMQPIFYRAKFC